MNNTTHQRASWLIQRLQDLFEQSDFQHVPSYNQFRKTTQNGFQNIIYSITNYDELSIADIFIGVRNEAVEQLVRPFVQGLGGFTQENNTIVTSIRNYQEEEIERFKIYTPKDTHFIVEQSSLFLNSFGFQLLDELDQIASLHEVLNDISQPKSKWSLNPFNRAIRGISAAQLAFYPNFDLLVQYYLDDLERRYTIPEQLSKYKQLAAFLRTYSAN
ncbi:MAG: hypothetical protein AAF849_11210 [Bacteroidota bacterium]